LANSIRIGKGEGFIVGRRKDGYFCGGKLCRLSDCFPFLSAGEACIRALDKGLGLLAGQLDPSHFLPTSADCGGNFGQGALASRLRFAEVENEEAIFRWKKIAYWVFGCESEGGCGEPRIGFTWEWGFSGGERSVGTWVKFSGGGGSGEVWAGFSFG
jgi:hypothetical protein